MCLKANVETTFRQYKTRNRDQQENKKQKKQTKE
jgi:hypothetical protein